MAGVMAAFAQAVSDDAASQAHLVLAGPQVSGVSDDPEGAEVLAECRERWRCLPDTTRPRIHLASLPMDDIDENATIVNALQRHAAVVVQKSLAEGFGLTVTEPMWKRRAVVASRVGGIQDQITHEKDGLLLDDPADLDTFAALLHRVLTDEAEASRLGQAAHARVLDRFLGDRHLDQYVDLFANLVADHHGR
jgi:trehalose synthase